jgi:hypothetical protein
MIFETEIGRNYVMQMAFEYMGEEKQKEMTKLIEQNLMTQAGMPTALMDGVFPSAPTGSTAPGGGNPGNVMSQQPGQAAGMGSASPARQSLGGIVAGGQGTASVNRDSGGGY